jgi:hypothetical protein
LHAGRHHRILIRLLVEWKDDSFSNILYLGVELCNIL